jgi:hypothetical protein
MATSGDEAMTHVNLIWPGLVEVFHIWHSIHYDDRGIVNYLYNEVMRSYGHRERLIAIHLGHGEHERRYDMNTIQDWLS